MHNVLAGYVERGEVPGLVALVSRKGGEHVDAIGSLSIGGGPMRRDTIFRISSMTKPITAVATMILVEECRLRLDEPVDRLLPELANRQVLKRIDGPVEDTEPAHRPITVRDLLTFRMGLGYLFPMGHPIHQAMAELGLGPGAPRPSADPAPDEFMRRLGTLPLMYQPGTSWLYNTSAEVLGVLVARASKQPFDVFLLERLFEPLGMKDTGFAVPAGKLDRLATSYMPGPPTGALEIYDPAEGGDWSRPPVFPNGGGGLVSTADDYLSFARMLMDGGRQGKARVLSRPSIELMSSDQLTPEQKAKSGFGPNPSRTMVGASAWRSSRAAFGPTRSGATAGAAAWARCGSRTRAKR